MAALVRSRWASIACLGIVITATFLAPGGPAIPLCQFRLLTHLPCLGCGLTRSFIGMAHLDLSRAAFYHPVGVVLFPLVTVIGALLPVPAGIREAMARRVEKQGRVVNWLTGLLLAGFVVNEIGRLSWLLATGTPSPW